MLADWITPGIVSAEPPDRASVTVAVAGTLAEAIGSLNTMSIVSVACIKLAVPLVLLALTRTGEAASLGAVAANDD